MKIKANLDSAAASVIAKSVVEANETTSVIVADVNNLSEALAEGEIDEGGVLRFSVTAGNHDVHIEDVVIGTADAGMMFATEGMNIHLLRGETQTFVLDLKKAEQKWSPNAVFEVGDDGVSVGTPASKEWAEDTFEPLS